jgi:hypothetical protein
VAAGEAGVAGRGTAVLEEVLMAGLLAEAYLNNFTKY